MGEYLNPGASGYRTTVKSAVFVDKTEMPRHLNSVVRTKQKYVCVKRPRRFVMRVRISHTRSWQEGRILPVTKAVLPKDVSFVLRVW